MTTLEVRWEPAEGRVTEYKVVYAPAAGGPKSTVGRAPTEPQNPTTPSHSGHKGSPTERSQGTRKTTKVFVIANREKHQHKYLSSDALRSKTF